MHVLLPAGVDDPARPSGGNVYGRRICHELAALRWHVHEHDVPGDWPNPDRAALAGLATLVANVPDDAVLLVDGLIASPAAGVLVPVTGRLRLVVLVHMLFAGPERDVFAAAHAVVTTSEWMHQQLIERYALPSERLYVAAPGCDPAPPAEGTAGGGQLLCVAALVEHKGQDVLVDALARLAGLPWTCTWAGPATDGEFGAALRRRATDLDIADRIEFRGPLTGTCLDAAYAAADALVVPSRAESYGMVVAEALARGLPVIASEVGGVPEALGRTATGRRPGMLVPPGDPAALATALRAWLTDPDLRARLRQDALARRADLAGWDATAAALDRALRAAAVVR